MKTTFSCFIMSLFALSLFSFQGIKAQDNGSKYVFQGIQRVNTKGGFRYLYDDHGKLKASVYYNSKGEVPHVDSIYYDEQGRINQVDVYQILTGDVPDKLPLDTRFKYTFDEKGRLKERIHYYGYNLNSPAGKKEFIYDENGNNTIIRTHLLSIGKVADMKYIYNDKNQRIKSGYPADNDPSKIVSSIKTYEYNEDGCMIRENSFSEEPNSALNGYVKYNYDGLELHDMVLMDVNEETGAETLYLTIKFGYDKEKMAADAYYPEYPFALDGPMFQNSIVEDAIKNGNLRTSMTAVDPDGQEGKNELRFAFLYKYPTSVKQVVAEKALKAFNSGSVLTVEGQQIADVAVYDMSGRVLIKVDARDADRIDIPADSFGVGTFIVVAHDINGRTMSTKVAM